MLHGNAAVVFMVVAVVSCVLSVVFAGVYYLNKAVNGSDAP